MVAMVRVHIYHVDNYRVVSHQGQRANLISVRCSDAKIWLIYVIVWLLGYCKWLLGCGYRVYWVIFKDYLPVINKITKPYVSIMFWC